MRCVLYLCSLIVISYAKEYLNETEVSWEKATKSCKVPEFYMLESSDDTGGCIDIDIPKGGTRQLSDYFANSNLSFIAVRNVFRCAFHCTNFKYFVHFMKICLCISTIENYPVIDNTGCVTTCPDDSVFCSSGFGIPLFEYQKDLKIARPTMYETAFYCAIENDGYYFDDNCYYGTYYVRCDGKDNIGFQTNWVDAAKHCTSLNTQLSKSFDNSSSGVWSRYFRYKILQPKVDTERRKCVAVFINRNKRPNSDSIKWSHYQYRNCSELLPFICMGDINMNFNITSVTGIPSNSSEKIDIDVIVKVNIVLLMLSIVMIVLFSVRVCCCKKKADPK
ncbi:unnamed protein product [Mytilus edulis]|uniref:Uncharacterized protein n=1 Tax=Mytilus edulis TaxID=6550 RepID=A0A8S3SA58_MYTED|nr:unnamed protein product [Mytilus edulis]